MENFSNLQESQSSLKAGKLEKKLGSKTSIMIQKVSKPLLKTRNKNQPKQQEVSETQKQALLDSSKTTTRAKKQTKQKTRI